jgi:hypothetical protein
MYEEETDFGAGSMPQETEQEMRTKGDAFKKLARARKDVGKAMQARQLHAHHS